MALKSFYNNSLQYNGLSGTLLKTKNNLESIVGSSAPTFTGMWDGGFAGISESGVLDIKNAINKYIIQIEESISCINYNLIGTGFKGAIEGCAIDFIDSIKSILQSYITMMRQNVNDLEYAYNKYIEATNDLSNMVFNDTADILNETKKLRNSVNLNSIN